MRARFRVAAGAIVILLTTALLASPRPLALAQTATAFIGQSVNDINIRAAPGVNASSIGILPAGEKVTAVGRNSGNNWIQIQFGSTTGWVAAWLTVYSGDTALLPIVSIDEPEPQGTPPFVMTSPFNVNMRATPGISGAILNTIPFTDQAVAYGRNDLSSWINVEYNGTTGWVAAWLVMLDGDSNALPILVSTGGAATPAATPPNAPSGPATPLPPPPEGGIAVQPPFRVNVRSGPSLQSPVISIIGHTDVAAAIGRNEGSNWLQIQFGSTTGWVARWVVLSSDDTSTLPITSSSTEFVDFDGLITGQSIYDVIIRSGPSINSGQVSVLPAYTAVPLLSRTGSSNWVKVDLQGTQGWVAAWIITASADMTNLPVEDVVP